MTEHNPASPELEIITEPLGGSPLAALAQNGSAPTDWFGERPSSVGAWAERAVRVRASTRADWWERVALACTPGGAALERLTNVLAHRGAVVTTGQQPGLFGGPVYTWSKAVSAIALADEMEEALGVPMVPVFWAATDDSDFVEASTTYVSRPGGARLLHLDNPQPGTRQLAAVPLGDVSDQLAALFEAAGSVADPRPLEIARRSYGASETIGSAYVRLLRELLEPLGVVVLDSAHPSVGAAARDLLVRALDRHEPVERALRDRAAEIASRGFQPQVAEVAERTLVFRRAGADGERERIRFAEAEDAASNAPNGELSPNVLLRPVLERFLLPTLAYVAGPGELAYFAQVSAVASALETEQPLAVPRWSATLIEPAVRRLLTRYGLQPRDLERADQVLGRLARAAWPATVDRALAEWRESTVRHADAMRDALGPDGAQVLSGDAVEGVRRSMTHRLERLERRINAAVKRRDAQRAFDIGTLEGALCPGGTRQERALNLLPILARHGVGVLERMRDEARLHARSIVRGQSEATPRT